MQDLGKAERKQKSARQLLDNQKQLSMDRTKALTVGREKQ